MELLDLVKKRANPTKTYVVDELARERGHEVVRLAPYNCDLNPIELIWSQLKKYVRPRNATGRLEKVRELIVEGVRNISADAWEACCEHVIKVEQEYWERDRVADQVKRFIIELGSDSDASSDSDSE